MKKRKRVKKSKVIREVIGKRPSGQPIIVDEYGIPNACNICGRHYCDH